MFAMYKLMKIINLQLKRLILQKQKCQNILLKKHHFVTDVITKNVAKLLHVSSSEQITSVMTIACQRLNVYILEHYWKCMKTESELLICYLIITFS